MNTVQRLVREALAAEQELNEVLDETERRMRGDLAARDLEEELDSAIEDGQIDAAERAKLARLASAIGADAEALGLGDPGMSTVEPISGDALEDVARRVRDALRSSSTKWGEDYSLQVRRNTLLSDISFRYQSAAAVMHADHTAGMSIIGNMRA